MRARQKGITTVEAALVMLLALVTLFGVMEIARAMYVFNALEEATRRGARVAAVCQVNDPAIAQIASFNASGSPVVSGLTPANILVQYIDFNGNVLADPMAAFGIINYVRVSIVNYTHQLLIPLFVSSLTVPSFAATIPAESLGVWPGGFSPC
jgi:Flp pilus assembly protein TadG